MSRTTRRAGAFATAAILLVFILGAEATGAMAQTETAPPIDLAAAAAVGAAAQDQVRFVATPVVQDLADPDTADIDAEGVDGLDGDYDTLKDLVAATDADGDAALGRELTCLAQAIYFEARGEPLAGQLAVARVIINRAASPHFPDDYCSVVTQRAQFSFVHGGHIPAARQGSPAWRRATRIARIAHEDLWPTKAGDALYFHAGRVHPRWAGRRVELATIDSHVFYR